MKVQASKDSPFLQEPLLTEFWLRNATPATRAVMDGAFNCMVGIPQCTQDLLASLCLAPIPNDVQPFLDGQLCGRITPGHGNSQKKKHQQVPLDYPLGCLKPMLLASLYLFLMHP